MFSFLDYRIWGERLINLVIRLPYLICTLVFLLSILSLLQIVDFKTLKPLLELDPSVDSILPTHDAGRTFLDKTRFEFDSSEAVMVALHSEEVFTIENLEKIQLISEALENLDMVKKVTSLSTALNIRSYEDELLIQPFFESLPDNEQELMALKNRALSDPIYAGNLISEDSKTTVIMVYLLDKSEKDLLESGVDGEIADVVKQYWTKGDVWLSGSAHVKAEMSSVMLRDVTTVVPLAMLVMALISFLSFRSVRGVLIPVITVAISVLITLAFIALCYKTLNQVSIAVPSLIVVLGFSYSIHVLASYYDLFRHDEAKSTRSPAHQTLLSIAAPVIYTGITTAVGFFSLATSSLSAIQQFGISAGVGVLVTMLVSLSFVPAVLQVMPAPRKIKRISENTWLDRFFEKLAAFDIKHTRPIFFGSFLLVIFCLYLLPQINIGTDLVNSFKTDSDVYRDFHAVNDNLQGANSFDIVYETTVEDGFKDPDNLKVIEELQAWLKTLPEVGGSTSIVDYIKVINKGLSGRPDSYSIPVDAVSVSQLLQIGGNDELSDFANNNYQMARVVVRMTAIDSSKVMHLADKIHTYLEEKTPDHLSAQITGNSYLIAKTMDDIAIGQAVSIATAFIIIYIILSFIFTSFKSGFTALIPNMVPVLLYFGILGLSGINLNVTTGLVACIVLGIAVDDTIHMMATFNRIAKQKANVHEGVLLALKHVGRPVTYTTIALCLGFSCMMLSDMRTQIEFGVLAAITLFGAWVSDVVLTPAIASRMKIVTLFDVLTVNLGTLPTKSIPFLSGLTETQAKITALMADLKEYAAGTTIFRDGDVGDNMFVVIDGVLRVSLVGEKGEEIHLKDIKRGDLVGEVALYHGVRTANVTAISNVRLLEITKDDLESIQRRHPKIAAKLYKNLNDVFAQRFADLTDRVYA